ncbi:alpha amylase catalytic region [Caldithrix abyssi DSM 13497]|uniref:Alpha amylase catalytic region n=1 Tax=Caldithrix abyssi DSM 13497 TaxID=880073 RepID=H1XT50_CALAY|nr:sugar phosphorylase [Caldithrix abyssi]APF18629.1 sucrose phosphorylase [Caldithrix abyssi DSM 13497]EHO42617.1 alpha amylase catalytic region [Caldithrix abyssi DSM 13497]
MRCQEDRIDRRKFHYSEPDYTRPVLNISDYFAQRFKNKLTFLYGKARVENIYPELERILKVYYAHKTPMMLEWEKNFDPENRFTECDAILITYGDLIKTPNQKPLRTLSQLSETYLRNVINTLHILPFFPSSSDRGFAVMDFEEVDPNLGTWDDILELKKDFKLMFDGVFNHVSSKSRWFQEFLNQNPQFLDFFVVFSTKQQLSPDQLRLIVRPRTTPILTEFNTLNGKRLVWTTFSQDQIDLNYHNPHVLLKMIEILLTYVRRGADIIRLDAVTYLWEELGTSCVHLEQTHTIIKLFRDILNAVAPHVAIITETNVPHQENIRYFGNGRDEAQMVYNFALPPLVLHSFQTENAKKLTEWAATLKKPSDEATFFNFLDSHDGVGVMAVQGILTQEEIDLMALRVVEHGGYISYKANPDGSLSPYELNITWFSAINNEDSDEPMEIQVSRYIASRAIALVLMGVPGIYLHGFLGSKNDADLVIEEKSTRSINRKTLNKKELLRSLENPQTTTYHVTRKLVRLIEIRKRQRAFHPNSPQKILKIADEVFCVIRYTQDHKEIILTLTNVSSKRIALNIKLEEWGILGNHHWRDLLSKRAFKTEANHLSLVINPYEILWLKALNGKFRILD